jgi:hypothetical protein
LKKKYLMAQSKAETKRGENLRGNVCSGNWWELASSCLHFISTDQLGRVRLLARSHKTKEIDTDLATEIVTADGENTRKKILQGQPLRHLLKKIPQKYGKMHWYLQKMNNSLNSGIVMGLHTCVLLRLQDNVVVQYS